MPWKDDENARSTKTFKPSLHRAYGIGFAIGILGRKAECDLILNE